MSNHPTTLITGRTRSYPGHHPDWTPVQQLTADEILGTCISAGVDPDTFSDIDPVGGDFEDFWEDAVRISAAYQACAANAGAGLGAGNPARVSSDLTELALATQQGRRLGPVAVSEQMLGRHTRDRQLTHPVFLAHAGRTVTPVTLNFDTSPEVGTDLITILLEHARRGVTRMVLKSTTAKAGVWMIELYPEQSQADLAEQLLEVLGWSAIHAESRPGQLVLQDYVPMTWEMRHFIVDGELITSAGCVEEHTPLNAVSSGTDGEPIIDSHSDLLRKHRGTFGQQEPTPVTPPPASGADHA